MNGFSLLIAVAALGVDVGWEAGPGGQTYYTVHIEKLLLEPLREGQAIVSNVDTNDRNLTRFQILFGEHAHAISSQPGPSGPDMVQHGWRPGENGGTHYLIQISPERLESLAKGSSIIGQIDPQVTDIRKLYVFSGTQQLPQQLPQPAAASNELPPAPKYLGTGGGLRTASGETVQQTTTPTRVGAPRFTDAQFNGGQSPASNPANDFPAAYGGSAGGPAKSANNFATNGANGGAPQYDNRQPAQGDWRTSGQPTAWANDPAAAQGGTGARYGTDDRMLPVPQLPGNQFSGNQQPGYQQPGYGAPQSQQAYAPPAQPGFSQPNPAYGQQNPAYAAPAPATNQNVESLIAQAKALGALEARAAAAEAEAKVKAIEAAKTQVSTTDEKAAEEPWLPLILTTLMLFTSLAVNVFLGWLAWSFFWRFRDAAGDATRAQTTLFPTRQAA